MEKKLTELRLELSANIDKLDMASRLVDELLAATRVYPILKKLFWNVSRFAAFRRLSRLKPKQRFFAPPQSDKFYRLLASQIARYLPRSPANMRNGDESLVRRLGELDCCVGLVETLSEMLSETEFLRHRNEFLYAEKCCLLVQLVDALIAEPEQAGSHDVELDKLTRDLTHTLSVASGLLVWEVVHLLSLGSWTSEHYSLERCCARIEQSPGLASFVRRLMLELEAMVLHSQAIVLSARHTVTAYKMFSLLASLLDKSTSGTLRSLLRDSYAEEFKYYYCEDKMRLRTFSCYPLVDDLLAAVRRVERHLSKR
jgi:hypothetical protein